LPGRGELKGTVFRKTDNPVFVGRKEIIFASMKKFDRTEKGGNQKKRLRCKS